MHSGNYNEKLPAGHKSKDLDKLISLLSEGNFWDLLPQEGVGELEMIATAILQR